MKNTLKIVLSSIVVLTSATVFPQDKKEDKIKFISNEACTCVSKIDGSLNKDKRIEEINSCIKTNTLLYQLKAVNAASESNNKEAGKKQEYTITLDENFQEIQAYMNTNCNALQQLMAANAVPTEKVLSKNKKAMQFYEEGLDYTNKQQYSMALISYNNAVKADPKFVVAWDYLGLNYRRLNNFSEAIKCYRKSLELYPDGIFPVQNMAIAYEYLKDYKQAANCYVVLISKDPANPEGYYGAGRTLFIIEDYEKGLDYMFKAYNMYKEVKSPYVNDALKNLKENYTHLKEKNKLQIFMDAAKNNNVNIKE